MQAGDSTFNATLPVLLEFIGEKRGGWKVKADPSLRDPYMRVVYAPDGTHLGQHHIEDAKHLLRLVRQDKARWVPEALVESVLDALATKLHSVPDGSIIGRWVRTEEAGRVTFATPGGWTTVKELPARDVDACLGNIGRAIRRTASTR